MYSCKVSKSEELFVELVPVVGLWWEEKKTKNCQGFRSFLHTLNCHLTIKNTNKTSGIESDIVEYCNEDQQL
jgi:hypothetical protein